MSDWILETAERKYWSPQRPHEWTGNRFYQTGQCSQLWFSILRHHPEATIEPVIETNYAHRINRILNLIYGFFPENGQLTQLNITERKDSNFVTVNIPTFTIENNRFQSTIKIKEDTLTQQWKAAGELNRKVHTLQAELFATEKESFTTVYQPPFWSRSYFRYLIL